MGVQLAYYTDKGTKKAVNEDSLVLRTAGTVNGPLVMAAVCDGVGGRAHGELASSTAVRELSEWFDERLPLLLENGYDLSVFRAGVEFIIRRISSLLEGYEQQHGARICTTLTILFLYDGHCITANVGDSRIYAIGTETCQLTKDHSVVQQDIDKGLLRPEEAEADGRRNIILQCLGESAGLAPDILEQHTVSGSVYLLCSDGFRHQLTLREIRDDLWPAAQKGESEMTLTLKLLAERAMARGETDNITAVAVRLS